MTSSKRPPSGSGARTSKGSTGGFRDLVKRVLVIGVVCAVIGALAFVVLYLTTDIPEANADFQAETTLVYYDDGETELGRFAQQNRIPVKLRKIPQNMQDAVIAAEDRSFWTNEGIDPKGIVRAFFSNLQGNSTQGASTITQQYVKILYLTSEQTYVRKLKEAIVSLKIHDEKSKREILEGYLNTIYFGRGAYGIQAAAQAYFDRGAEDLTLRQSATLSSILNSPGNYEPEGGKAERRRLRQRFRYVLDGMADMGTISKRRARQASRRLPRFPEIEAQSQYGGQKGHMLELVRDELAGLGFSEQEIEGGGLRVTTTLNQDTMADVQESVLEQKPAGFGDENLHIGAASVEVGTGALKGFYGGQDYLQSQINWAATGGMAGSTMKAFTVAAAIEQGFSLEDTFEGNSPLDIYDITVENEGAGSGTDYGSAVSLLTATAESINTAFVDISDSMEEGPKSIYRTARSLGIPPPKARKKWPGIPSTTPDFSRDDFLITLGRARVSPINMANSYASIANGGERADVHVVTEVVDSSGDVRYAHKQSTERAIEEDVAADTSYALEQVVEGGTGTTVQAIGRPAAGKTGTATNSEDGVSSAWFAGYTPQVATAVMYVRGDGDDTLDGWLPSYYGSSYPASTWTAIMQRVMEGKPVEELDDPLFLDGDAPSEGHEPYVPPPPPETTEPPPPPETTEPPPPPPETTTSSPSPTQTSSPSPTPTQTTSEPPEEEPPQEDCDVLEDCTPNDQTGGSSKGGNDRGKGGPD